MKNFILSIAVITACGSFSTIRAEERANLCPADSTPITEGVKNSWGEKFKGIKDDPLAVGSSRTYCIPLLSDRDYMLLAAKAKTANYSSDVGALLELISPDGEVTSLDISAPQKTRLEGVLAGAHLLRVSTFLKNGKSCASSPALCKNPVNVTINWKLFETDPNLKLKCPRDTVLVQTPHASGWTYVKSAIRGGDTIRYCALPDKPWFGIEFSLGSYTQQSCGRKTMKVYSTTQTGIDPAQTSGAEPGIRVHSSVRAGVWIIEVTADQAEMANCTESFNIAWRHTVDRLF